MENEHGPEVTVHTVGRDGRPEAVAAVVVAVSGDVDTASGAGFHDTLNETIRRWVLPAADPPLLVIDLTGVGFIDSAGLGTLVDAARAARLHPDAPARICACAAAGSFVRRALQVTRVDRLVPVHGDVNEALARES